VSNGSATASLVTAPREDKFVQKLLLKAEVQSSRREARGNFGARLFVTSLRCFSDSATKPVPSAAEAAELGDTAACTAAGEEQLPVLANGVESPQVDRATSSGLGLSENAQVPGVSDVRSTSAAGAPQEAARALPSSPRPRASAAEASLEGESSPGGWTSDGDDEVLARSTLLGPLAREIDTFAPEGAPSFIGRRPVLHFHPDVPQLRLPRPGVGIVGGPEAAFDKAALLLGPVAPDAAVTAAGPAMAPAAFPAGNFPQPAWLQESLNLAARGPLMDS